jgi:hypothetical protein
MSEPRKFRAIRTFTYPDGPAEAAKAKRGDIAKARRLEAAIGDKLSEPAPEVLKSWLANRCVEEVE